MTLFTHSIGTVSWIDPRLSLPEKDVAEPPTRTTRRFLTGTTGFRFTNFLEAKILVADGRIVSHAFTRESGIYRAPSFGGIASEYYNAIRTSRPASDHVVFTQIVGARTRSPEQIGEFFGPAGRMVAHAITGFPPIWTELELTLRADGTFSGRTLRYSMFPSMSFYVQEGDATSYLRPRASYDARPQLAHWQRRGWGTVSASAVSGPKPGNPWGISGGAADDLYRSYTTPP